MGKALHKVTTAFADGRGLRAAVLVTVALGLLLPIAAGLWQTTRAGLGVLPAIGATELSLRPFVDLIALPGFSSALRLTLVTGLVASALSLVLAVGVCAAMHGRISPRASGRLLTPFLAAPHAAMAIGLVFLLSPSGWIARALAPLAGWDRPPLWASVNDPAGFALILGLMVKEVPFLLLVILSALSQIPLRQHLAAGRSLGYGRGIVWIKVIMPQVWPLIRLPVMVVLAYSLSVVDMALILGPSHPPTLAVLLLRLFTAPDIAMLLPASAGALMQALLVAAAFALLWVLERVGRAIGRWWVRRGGRGSSVEPGLWLATGLAALLFAAGGAGDAVLADLVSGLALVLAGDVARKLVAARLVDTRRRLGRGTRQHGDLGRCHHRCVARACHRMARGRGPRKARAHRLGRGADLSSASGAPDRVFVRAECAVFASGAVGRLSGRDLGAGAFRLSLCHDRLVRSLARAAGSLGAGPWRRLFTIKLPVLMTPILTAAAIGIAVSVAQYLPTLFMGAGRIATLTTEAVTLSSASDRRVTGVYATLQTVLPFAAYGAAFLIPALVHRNRRALLPGGAT